MDLYMDDRIDYIIWHGTSLTTTTGKIYYYARCVNGYCVYTLILRSGLFTLRNTAIVIP